MKSFFNKAVDLLMRITTKRDLSFYDLFTIFNIFYKTLSIFCILLNSKF